MAQAPLLALRAHRVGPAAPNAALLIHSIVVGLCRVALLHTHKPFLTAERWCPDPPHPPSQTEFNTQHPTGEAAAAAAAAGSPQPGSTGIISTGKFVTSGDRRGAGCSPQNLVLPTPVLASRDLTCPLSEGQVSPPYLLRAERLGSLCRRARLSGPAGTCSIDISFSSLTLSAAQIRP